MWHIGGRCRKFLRNKMLLLPITRKYQEIPSNKGLCKLSVLSKKIVKRTGDKNNSHQGSFSFPGGYYFSFCSLFFCRVGFVVPRDGLKKFRNFNDIVYQAFWGCVESSDTSASCSASMSCLIRVPTTLLFAAERERNSLDRFCVVT